jgi:drug/metabolite transporter (DMT)-like permease
MALYSLWSKPFIRRSGPISFTTFSMGVGALCLIAISYLRDGFKPVAAFSTPQWLALLYLGIFGGALTFYLWAFALSRTTPTRVAISVAVNPLSAAIVGALLLDEAVGWNIVTGLVAVFTGIWIATAAKKSVSLSQHKS